MNEKENKDQLLIQEYQCGEKANAYRVGHGRKSMHLSTTKSKANASFLSLFRAFFYPDNYPLSVSADYGIYQVYNILQTGCLAISGALAFDALLRGMGVGHKASTALAASVVWLLRDGAGMIGRILFAWGFAATLDADCKRWHFLGDVLNDMACILDLLTANFPSALLFISSVSNICRAITWVIHGSTRTVIFQHQARNNNLADITAKCSSLETMVSLLALFVNVVLLSTLPSALIWPTFLLLTGGHLWANYKAKRCILFNIFNHARFHLACAEYFRTDGQRTLTIEQVNAQEQIIFKTPLPYVVHLGLPLHRVPDRIFPSHAQLDRFHHDDFERFLILYDKEPNTFYVLLRPTANTDDLIRLSFFVEILSCAMHSRSETSTDNLHALVARVQRQLPDLPTCLNILREDNDRCYDQFKQVCLQHGYNFHRCLFNVDTYRMQ